MINAHELNSYTRTQVEMRRQAAEEYRLARLATGRSGRVSERRERRSASG
jgi:hypothetical protein